MPRNYKIQLQQNFFFTILFVLSKQVLKSSDFSTVFAVFTTVFTVYYSIYCIYYSLLLCYYKFIVYMLLFLPN